jgi:hypothetical protein
MQINDVSESALQSLRAKLTSTHQAEITGTTEGAITGHGITAAYRYDAATRTLHVDVQHHPFFIPVSAIESQLRQALGV